LDLIQAGYRNIDQVRNGIHQGKLRFSRNQLVGVDCYEDILEKMNRDEVGSIGSIVARAIESLGFSSAEATIMGSFRRGKTASGDVDVLITFKDHIHSVPEGALQQLVDLLSTQGHIAHHLTFLPGMSTGIHRSREESDDQLTGDIKLEPPLPKSGRKSQQAKSKGGSYMGVFYSPKEPRKRRRVDIKIYPQKQKPFACLYFTGSAQFNRSMRLFAKQRFGLRLTDRGIFDASGKSVMNGASTEKEIFERLKLVYKDPPSRRFFDDVVPLQ
jgi:DNA polymerase/3'-5' exonuclease PolX